MGYRYRKSINLGGGFRINLSKSGVGYSWGVKGYRITKTAKGTIRQTTSIPGTGISYVKETRLKETQPTSDKTLPIDSNHYATEEIINGDASMMISDGLDEILSAAKKTLIVDKIATIGLIVFLILTCVYYIYLIPFVLFVALKIYARTAGLIDLEYDIDDDQKEIVSQRLEPMIRVTTCQKLWRITQSSEVINRKYSAGAGHTVKRVACKASQKPPFPFKANTLAASFKSGDETLVFLPDKLFILQGGEIGALCYSDISASANTTSFVEHGSVPSDAKIIGQTWQYVNKSGGPDKRFTNNRQLPICLYGELKLKSASGLNTVIMFSNADLK